MNKISFEFIKEHLDKGEKMEKEKELFTVSCVHCNKQIFQFSKNLLEDNRYVILHCLKCDESTQVVYDSVDGVTIRAY